MRALERVFRIRFLLTAFVEMTNFFVE